MFRYKTVKIKVGGFLIQKPKEDYKEVIDQHARDGWRFVQIFAPALSGNGKPTYFELIFEKSSV